MVVRLWSAAKPFQTDNRASFQPKVLSFCGLCHKLVITTMDFFVTHLKAEKWAGWVMGLIQKGVSFQITIRDFMFYGIWETIQCNLLILWMRKQKAQRMAHPELHVCWCQSRNSLRRDAPMTPGHTSCLCLPNLPSSSSKNYTFSLPGSNDLLSCIEYINYHLAHSPPNPIPTPLS